MGSEWVKGEGQETLFVLFCASAVTGLIVLGAASVACEALVGWWIGKRKGKENE